jgi:glutamine cyclotransferase
LKKIDYRVLVPAVMGALAITTAATSRAQTTTLPVYAFVVKQTYPHDPQAFTQGLFFKDGHLFEGTGLKGQSSIRKVQLETGKVLQKRDIAEEFFGEGITPVGNDIAGLTWTSHVGFIYDGKTFAMKRRFNYAGEGWGLATDGSNVYMSDGTPAIRILDPKTFAEIRRIQVSAEGRPIPSLNELEWVEGQLFANIWGTDVIARIDPASGKVVGWIDMTGLKDPKWEGMGTDDVLNGIAYDAKKRRLFVTGKHWPKLFEIELVERVRQR